MAQRSLKPSDPRGADKGYVVREYVDSLKKLGLKRHGTARKTGSSMHSPCATRGMKPANANGSWQRECFGWVKTIGHLRKTRVINTARVHAELLQTFAAYNLTRMMTMFGWRGEFRQAESASVM